MERWAKKLLNADKLNRETMKFEIYVSESKNKPTIFHNIADVNPPKTEPAIESFFNIF